MTTEVVTAYADGACKGNPGPGGWGVLLVQGGRERELHGGEPATTNNRMELTAVIQALEAAEAGAKVVLYTDSQYVQKGITEWIHAWKRRGWKTADRKPVKNVDLWQRLDALAVKQASLGKAMILLASTEDPTFRKKEREFVKRLGHRYHSQGLRRKVIELPGGVQFAVRVTYFHRQKDPEKVASKPDRGLYPALMLLGISKGLTPHVRRRMAKASAAGVSVLVAVVS